MQSNIYLNETNNIDQSNETLSSIKSITFIKINNILGDTRLNYSIHYMEVDMGRLTWPEDLGHDLTN
jgi:hypothetical protein